MSNRIAHTSTAASFYCHSHDTSGNAVIATIAGDCAHVLDCGHVHVCDSGSHGYTVTAEQYAVAAGIESWFDRITYLAAHTDYATGAARRRLA